MKRSPNGSHQNLSDLAVQLGMWIITAISLILLLLYLAKIHGYKRNWRHCPEILPDAVRISTPLSVIIAFRNESSHLPALLHALAAQDYPASLYEVILVNDHSEDDSASIASDYCIRYENFILLSAADGEIGKKSALVKGIAKASYDHIVTTDADCTMPVTWLRFIALTFQQHRADLIVGLMDISSDAGFFGKFQEAEFLSLVASGAAAAAGNHPIYCNGANLAYRKSAFYSGTDAMRLGIISGDDTLFLHTVKKAEENHILLLKSRAAVVTTRGVQSWNDFLQQRKRWISKSLHYKDKDTVYTALLVLLVNLSLLYGLALLISGTNFWLFPVMYAAKFFTDRGFLTAFYRYYNKAVPAGSFIIYELIYPFYIIFFALVGLTAGFTWKGRRSDISYPAPT